MIASTRNLLLKMSFFFRYLSPAGGNAAALITLVMAQIMVRLQRKGSAWGAYGERGRGEVYCIQPPSAHHQGMYFTSMVILMRMNMPLQYR